MQCTDIFFCDLDYFFYQVLFHSHSLGRLALGQENAQADRDVNLLVLLLVIKLVGGTS